MYKSFAIVVCLLCLSFQLIAQASTVSPKPKPSIGIQGGFMTGKVNLKNYPGEFESFSSPVIGIAARFFVAPKVQIQPELSFYRRAVDGNYEDPFLGNYNFKIDQKGAEAGFLVRYEPFLGNIRPYIAGGISMGFLNPKSASQRISTGVLQNDFKFKINSNDTNGLLELGVTFFANSKVQAGLSGRYYLSANNATLTINDVSGVLQGSSSHSGNFNRLQAQLGVFLPLVACYNSLILRFLK